MYTFFLGVYKTSIVVGVSGYMLLLLELFGIGALLRPILSPSLSIQMLWYGLYFGVLGRDCAEVVSDTLVSPSPSHPPGIWGQRASNTGILEMGDISHTG